ncbi:MAG TPA: hypothetical protein VJU82_09975 [Acidobacteriaceae bacterium]|nr:hypothetical protein [Acidobacteriaceae bacterium]
MTGPSLLALAAIERILKTRLSPERLPNIRSFGPQPVEQGVPFNVQPDGHSSMWMQAESPPPHQTRIVFGGRALATSVQHDSLTAVVPSPLTKSAGLVPVWIEALQSDGVHVSEPVFFDVRRPPRPEETRTLKIEAFGPEKVEAGQPFNLQSDGTSAIWMKLDRPPPAGFRLYFGGAELSANADGTLVTATVAPELTAKPGKVAARIGTGGDERSMCEPVYFEVRPS